MNTKTLTVFTGALLVVAPLLSSAAELPAAFEGRSVLQADGVVKRVEPSRHQVTVVDSRGSEASFTVTDSGNLTQLQPGAKVHIRMTRNATISVIRGANEQGAAPSVRAGAGAGSDAIGTASADAASQQSVTADVQSIDRSNGVIALKGAAGAVFHIQSHDPARLAAVREGMQVTIAFAPQVSVAVAPVQ